MLVVALCECETLKRHSRDAHGFETGEYPQERSLGPSVAYERLAVQSAEVLTECARHLGEGSNPRKLVIDKGGHLVTNGACKEPRPVRLTELCGQDVKFRLGLGRECARGAPPQDSLNNVVGR